MKYKLLSVNTPGFTINIGDYIQALASSQFLPSNDGFISRENLNSYNEEETKIILNGWFMHIPENWPPSNKIKPLFVAFHINTYTKGKMLSPIGVDYFKRHEPIGCRDLHTVNQLLEHGIKAYFSGCMTLTLGYKYKSDVREDKCYFVDPTMNIKWNKIKLLCNFIGYLKHKKDIDKLSPNFKIGIEGIRKKLRIVSFYHEYLKYFSHDTIMNAEYIFHEDPNFRDKFKTDKELLAEAERLIIKYSKAKLIVTSRIHCALPCIGLETPVIYINSTNGNYQSSCRLGGLLELFNVLEWKNNHLISNFKIEKKLSINYTIPNKKSWIPIKDKLIRTVEDFFQE